jgi:hypothetical protein
MIILGLILLALLQVHFSTAAFIPQENLSIFNDYHNLLTYIFNETRVIGEAIANQIDDFIVASSEKQHEPSDDVIADIFMTLIGNEPQMPEPPVETFDDITCDEILGELQTLFDLSKYFLLKAARNEESIKTLKAVVIGLLQSDMDNMQMVVSMVETIADNYRAQNHVLTTIEQVDKEIEDEMRSVARFCNESRLMEEIDGDY